ncbi:MAG: hypothetical protein ACPG61_10300 [Paracoccaceae bacterium]
MSVIGDIVVAEQEHLDRSRARYHALRALEEANRQFELSGALVRLIIQGDAVLDVSLSVQMPNPAYDQSSAPAPVAPSAMPEPPDPPKVRKVALAPGNGPRFKTGPWEQEEIDQAVAMASRGCTTIEIGRRLGRKPNSVGSIVARRRGGMEGEGKAATDVTPVPDAAAPDAAAPDAAAPDAAAPDAAVPDAAVPVVAGDLGDKSERPPSYALAKKDGEGFRVGTWGADELEIVHQLLDEGVTNTIVAARLGRKPKPVSVYLANLRRQRRERGDSKDVARAPKVSPPQPSPPSQPTSHAPVSAPTADAEVALVEPVQSFQSDPPSPRPIKASKASESRVGKVLDPPGQAGQRPFAERQIIAHLNGLGYIDPWSAARDLELVEGIARGVGLSVVAAGLKVVASVCSKRWRALNTNIGDIAHQQRLVTILRERAALVEGHAGVPN